MALIDRVIRTLKPKDKVYRLFDGAGLYLEIAPSGGRWWRFKYRFAGKEKRISLGVYPDIGLKDAREARDAARRLMAKGVDPAEHRKAARGAQEGRQAGHFEVVAREWFGKFSKQWAASHADKVIRRMERDIFPWIGARPVAEIAAPELLSVLRRIENRGAIETAHRALQSCGQVFLYAIATGRADRNVAGDLRGALPPTKEKHHASIVDPKAIGALLRAIDGYQGSLITQSALLLAPLVFVRPGELRKAEWSEIDLDKAEWRIPAERMKMRQAHIVPLSERAVDVLRHLQPVTGSGRYVFPGVRTNQRPMSENTVNAALRRLGFAKDEMTGHGFRSMASTLLNEQGWNRDAIERQLAHAERNAIRAAYNYAEHLPERRKMMQAWSDYLDTLRIGATPILLKAIGT